MSSKFPNVLRSFHLPSAGSSFASGYLKISGILSYTFPKSPLLVVVRSSIMPNDRVGWLRNFGGRSFLPSVFSRSCTYHGTNNVTPFHDIESVFPFDLHFDWEQCDDMKKITPKHLKTTLLGVIPIPKWLLSIDMSLLPSDESTGWTLTMRVSSLGGYLTALGYDGEMRIVQSDTNYIKGFHHLVLYDGHCNMCNASVDFLMKFDTQGRFIYCAQSDPEAHTLLRMHGFEPPPSLSEDGEDGSVLLLTADGELIDKAHAPLYALKLLGFPFNLIGQIGLFVPRSVSDTVYDAIARRRYAMFGKTPTCRVPTREERGRFLHRTVKTAKLKLKYT